MPRVRKKEGQQPAPAQATAAQRTAEMFPAPPQAPATGSPIPSTTLPPETGQRPTRVGEEQPHSAQHRAMEEDEGSVTVTWGEELFTPVNFHSYRVGPFTVTASILAGETISAATVRVMNELEQVAQRERVRKRAVYEAALQSVGIGR